MRSEIVKGHTTYGLVTMGEILDFIVNKAKLRTHMYLFNHNNHILPLLPRIQHFLSGTCQHSVLAWDSLF